MYDMLSRCDDLLEVLLGSADHLYRALRRHHKFLIPVRAYFFFLGFGEVKDWWLPVTRYTFLAFGRIDIF